MKRWLTAAAQLAFVAGCSNLPEIEHGTCGNAVIENDRDYQEDCDTFPGVEGSKCRPPGAEGACHWDCRTQSDGSTPTCPPGWGCDAQGICGEPSGGFQESAPIDAGAVSWLGVADFDGDSRPDLITADAPNGLAQARFQVHYLDDEGEPSETRVFPKQTTRPLIARLDDDKNDDLLFTNLEIGLLPGRRDRNWVPATFSTYQLDGNLRMVSVNDASVSEVTALAVIATIDGERGVFLPASDGGDRLKLVAKLPAPLNQIVGEPVVADLIEGGDSPCRELLLAFQGQNALHLYDLCGPGELDPQWRAQPVESSVALPEGGRLEQTPVATDLDADGHLDIVLGDAAHAYVAYGDGLGVEPLAHPLELDPGNGEGLVQMGMPLAIGDFTGDGVADFVMPAGVLGSRLGALSGNPHYEVVYVNQNEPWTVARIADLNADGDPDVVAASAHDADLTFLNGTGELFQVPSTLETRGPVPFLAIDDFDGDAIDDIAFVERDPARPGVDALQIGFGQHGGPPLPPIQVAQLEGAEQLSAFHEHGIGSLMLSSSEQIDGRKRGLLTLLPGSPDRLPFAPFDLVRFAQDGSLKNYAALMLAVGAFSEPGARDLLALATTYHEEQVNLSFFRVPDIGRGKDPPRQLSGGLPEGFEAAVGVGARVKVSVASASADLDGDGRDESAWLMPAQDGRCGLFMAGVDAAGEALRDEVSLLFDAECRQPVLAAVDLDRDEHVDLLLGLGDGLRVLWNDGAGKFDPSTSALIEPAQSAVLALAVFDEKLARVALVVEDGLWLAKRTGDARRFGELQQLATLREGRAVAIADVNGDGLQDLAFSDVEGLRLWRARFK